MQVVVDTNVLISAIFFGGKPELILESWRTGKLDLLITEEILSEYVDVLHRISEKYPGVDITKIIPLITKCGILVEPQILNQIICEDPDDDKFIAAALGSSSKIIITGDKHLLDVSGYSGIEMIKPAEFVKKYLSEQSH
ncbi:MAG: putative toxin-antitoxin system toxin component, PIN family [Candidatus Sabulitectum sp.]|nr:putative toxin-antitoxin system toxin component, PIN family [Candidatus Sabulitectum sp.]